MSAGGDTITADSLFAFDDIFGEGTDCLHAAAVLKTLSPSRKLFSSGDDEEEVPATATMTDFVQVALSLKRKSAAIPTKNEAAPLTLPEEGEDGNSSDAVAAVAAGAAAGEKGKCVPAEISSSSGGGDADSNSKSSSRSSSSKSSSSRRRRSKSKRRPKVPRQPAMSPSGTVIGSSEAPKAAAAAGAKATTIERTTKSEVAHQFVLRLQQLGCPM